MMCPIGATGPFGHTGMQGPTGTQGPTGPQGACPPDGGAEAPLAGRARSNRGGTPRHTVPDPAK